MDNKTPFKKYITAHTAAYRSNYEDLTLVEEMVRTYEDFVKAGYQEDDMVVLFAHSHNLLVFQNPTIKDVIEELELTEAKYKEYKAGNTKLKGYLLGQAVKNYPGIDVEALSKQL